MSMPDPRSFSHPLRLPPCPPWCSAPDGHESPDVGCHESHRFGLVSLGRSDSVTPWPGTAR